MADYTPMMMQYLEVKKQYNDTIIFYRLGDFYEMFFDDAKIASKELDLILTSKAAGNSQKVPMCGIPYHAINNYLPKLVARGYKVAIVEQMEDPKATKKIVKRDVVRVVTAGTIADDTQKDSACICSIIDNMYVYTVCVVDASTGDTIAYNIDYNFSAIKGIILKNNIKEIVLMTGFNNKYIIMFREMGITISYCDVAVLDSNYKHLYSQIKDDKIIEAYGILVNYLMATQFQAIQHLRVVNVEDESEILKMDYSTIMNLELLYPLHNLSKNDTLWSFLDHCRTSLGSRFLKKMIEKPLLKVAKINERLDLVTIMKDNLVLLDELKSSLNNIYDISRLIGKIAMNNSNPLDLIRLKKSLVELPIIKGLLSDYPEYQEIFNIDDCQDLVLLIDSAINEDPPVNFKDLGIIKKGYDEELDRLIKLSDNNQSWILALENQEKEKTGIKNLKIGYSKIHGYYIEVSKGQIPYIKEEYGYIRKQTLTTGERYVTATLKAKEDEILLSHELALKKEFILYNDINEQIKNYLFKIQRVADVVAYIDFLYALAVSSNEFGYVRPEFSNDELIIKNGKHPILAKKMKEAYVNNDTKIKNGEIVIITGPNMGGKSTYMRQVALISIMAQIGCYVPASQAKLTVFDQIFTRIGASDDILSGQSTFMVEMNEANNALANATNNSLIIFDEIGRGTSTYDGMALASAMIEYIHQHIQAKTLFSTHYHELTALEQTLDKVVNYHAIIHEEADEVKFLYKIVKGKADKSYGINVARLAKLPDAVIESAKRKLNEYENDDKVVQQAFDFRPLKSINDNSNKKVIDMLKLVDPNNMTPLKALEFIMELKKEIN